MMEIIANQKAPHQSPHPSMLLSVFPRAALKRIAEAVAFVYNVEFPGRARRSRGGKGATRISLLIGIRATGAKLDESSIILSQFIDKQDKAAPSSPPTSLNPQPRNAHQ